MKFSILSPFILLFLSVIADESFEIDWSRVVRRSELDKQGKLKNSTRFLNDVEVESRLWGDGSAGAPHMYPFLVALIVQFSGADVLCHGSIISPAAVLTSAYCTLWSFSTQTIAGAHNIMTVEPTQQRRRTQMMVIHPGYDGINANDIAVHRMDHPFVYNDFIGPVSLPEEHHFLRSFTNELGFIAGEKISKI